ncbi:MAG: hypothetical protein JNK67_06310 [Alphaproteobacteria bacterium]|nr:hypothetical protein [Alphaproteobacteria bacterium]
MQPTPSWRVAGAAAPQLAAGLLELEIRRAIGQRTTCRARFGALGSAGDTVGLQLLDRQLLEFGRSIEIAAAGRTLFAGSVAMLEAEFRDGVAPAAGMRAEDRYGALVAQPRRRVFEAMSDAAIAARIAAEHGLAARIDIPGRALPRVVQQDQTDLEFLRARAAVNRVDLLLGDDALVMRRRRPGRPVTLALGAELRGYTGTASPTGSSAAIAGRAVLAGAPAIELGGGVELRGIGAAFEGGHVATAIVLRFDLAGGLQTELACERATLLP